MAAPPLRRHGKGTTYACQKMQNAVTTPTHVEARDEQRKKMRAAWLHTVTITSAITNLSKSRSEGVRDGRPMTQPEGG